MKAENKKYILEEGPINSQDKSSDGFVFLKRPDDDKNKEEFERFLNKTHYSSITSFKR